MKTGIHLEGHASATNEHTAAAIVAVAQAIEAMAGAARVLAEKVAGEVGITNTSISGATIGDVPAKPRPRTKP